ncbi:MAG: flagellar protein FlgN [Pseudomonadales bacterium]|jgi:flagella synthesis protein FlgN|nr:flagellar protein FlgN [Pseudomonadales bacterium]MCP5320819.1 flagellar protein FlgN [Pseudomonadales bacterium]MCP5337618.1 flagellar protein FlgN [Pseudomonadales bacterium]
MLAASDAGVVRAILDTDMKAVHELRALLLEERAALAAREPDALDRVVQRKLECLQCLQRNDQARQRMLARYRGIEWTTLLHAIDPTLTDSWQALRQLLEEVADLGRTNERIVARMQHASSRLLALLRGQNGTIGVYDRKGQTHACDDPHRVTRA